MAVKITGVALIPGVSLNRRWYTAEMIAGMVARGRRRIKTGLPLTMLTHHGAGDDSTRIAGRITALAVDADGRAVFEAELAGTAAGRDIAALVAGPAPFLKGVSIRGYFTGKVREVTGPDGKPATTADGLELDGIDFTLTPGVPGAGVIAAPAETGRGGKTARRLVLEDAPGPVALAAGGPLAGRALAQMSAEQLGAAVSAGMAAGMRSPFWRG